MSSAAEEADATPAEAEANDNTVQTQEVTEPNAVAEETNAVKVEDSQKEDPVPDPEPEPEPQNEDIGLPGGWRTTPIRVLETSDAFGSFLVATEEEPARPFEYVSSSSTKLTCSINLLTLAVWS